MTATAPPIAGHNFLAATRKCGTCGVRETAILACEEDDIGRAGIRCGAGPLTVEDYREIEARRDRIAAATGIVGERQGRSFF